MMKPTYDLHPACAAWPPMPDEKLLELADDIKANGLQNPIVITRDNLILDGRNRDLACQLAGVTIKTTVYKDDDPVGYVVSANKHRRHLTESQWVAVAAELMTLLKGGDGRNQHGKGCSPGLQPSSADLAREFGCHEVSIRVAKNVKDKAPQLFNWMKEGKIGVKDSACALRASGKDHQDWQTPADAKAAAKKLRQQRGYDTRKRSNNTSITKSSSIGKTQRQPVKIIDALGGRTLKPMTQQEVDPTFTGTPMEFTDKYGHVQIKTAEEYATIWFSDWAYFFQKLANQGKVAGTPRKFDHDKLVKSDRRDIARLTEALEYFRPRFAEAEALLARAVATTKECAK
jgi:hypothetical protein